MPYSQGEIVEVQFRIPPKGKFENHPLIILSNSEINQIEQSFVGVMMTTNNSDDEYSFPVTDDMLMKPYNDGCHREVRLHLIGHFLDNDVIKNQNSGNYIKKEHLKRIVTQINEITFDFNVRV